MVNKICLYSMLLQSEKLFGGGCCVLLGGYIMHISLTLDIVNEHMQYTRGLAIYSFNVKHFA